MRTVRGGLLVGIAVGALLIGSPAKAQTDKAITFDIPAQSLTGALREVARQGGLEFSAPADPLRGRQSGRLTGRHTIEDAARLLLADTKLTAQIADGALIVQENAASAKNDATGNGENELVITGTRLKSAPSASPMLQLDGDQIKLAGQTDLGQAIRSVPQNFGGGQNPGVGWGASGINNQNIDSSSTANLRGLGGDATLTLLNGHRLSYGSFVQAVDLGAIPLAAVERMDIVADGASAIYGTDAVGGVVNIVLKQGYDGASVAATLGGATDGGDFQQQYSAVGGRDWGSGSLIAAYGHQSNSAIYSGDRSYTDYMPDKNTLYPRTVQNSAVIALRQDVARDVEMLLDATYSRRNSFMSYVTDYGLAYEERPAVTSYSVTPSLRAGLAPGWKLTLSGTYGQSKSQYDEQAFQDGAIDYRSWGHYLNKLVNVEGYASGSLKGIAARPIDLVVGAGYRYNSYSYAPSGVPLDAGSVNSYYGFAEAALPLVAPEDGNRLAHRLILNGAIRYENYPGMASVAVPKLGLIYGPSRAFDLKASWGRSFKAPTLSQQFQQREAYLYSAGLLGGSAFPAGSTVLIDYGGNVDLKPEKAETWSATLDIHPPALDRFRASVNYFHVTYLDRIVQPVSGAALFNALSDPAYAAFVAYDPSSEELQRIISAASKYYDYSGGTGLSQTIAILYDRYVNAARQSVQGVDLSAQYEIALKGLSSLTVSGNASWLWSKQKTSDDAGEIVLAGTIFNPPHLRARGSAIWTDQKWTFAAYLNHSGGLEDNRVTPSLKIASQTTLDLSARFALPDSQPVLGGLTLQLSAQNVFNTHPPYARPSGGYSYYVNYDSTNFSPVGRFVSLTISKDW